ncbi:cytochrome b562 [Salmonella enterica]|nr:cytochrome b562 [Salmonella enterica]EKN5804813.1 cytochrome b562 [Salmonella enterica subsp. enterica]ELD8112367.1 cytochrome b562 [Salmonella enterica subsp. enterica serovar Benin]EBB6488046.1 cytochrome b562 [Salmonella enterica]EBC1279758.1 cytochrome b562 [Salmonella enterica]
MKKVFFMMTLGMFFMGAGHVFAADLDDDMDTLAQNLGVVQTTTDTMKMKAALENMRNAALDAQKKTPPKLEGKARDSMELKDYRHGLNILIGQIDQAKNLTSEGKIKEVKKIVNDLKTTRDIYHNKYR